MELIDLKAGPPLKLLDELNAAKVKLELNAGMTGEDAERARRLRELLGLDSKP